MLALEYGGRTMKAAIESGVFGEASGLLAANVISQLAAGLRHIHANGIIHSDLSYKNILLDEKTTCAMQTSAARSSNIFAQHIPRCRQSLMGWR